MDSFAGPLFLVWVYGSCCLCLDFYELNGRNVLCYGADVLVLIRKQYEYRGLCIRMTL